MILEKIESSFLNDFGYIVYFKNKREKKLIETYKVLATTMAFFTYIILALLYIML